jgi:hypothetical protein
LQKLAFLWKSAFLQKSAFLRESAFLQKILKISVLQISACFAKNSLKLTFFCENRHFGEKSAFSWKSAFFAKNT